MGDPAQRLDRKYTYSDYLTWPEGERWELIGGVAYNMSAAPNRRHQAIIGLLYFRIRSHLEGKACKVYMSPFDVLMPELDEPADGDISNVVEPDIVVYCDDAKLTKSGGRGAPDLIFEILSPSTHMKDIREKFDLYERMGVREYWVIDPSGEWLSRFVRGADGRYGEAESRDPLFLKGPVDSLILEGFSVDPADIFAAE
ncbi:MAG: Uma2 family endonuclease [Rectinemataceae bacterium]